MARLRKYIKPETAYREAAPADEAVDRGRRPPAIEAVAAVPMFKHVKRPPVVMRIPHLQSLTAAKAVSPIASLVPSISRKQRAILATAACCMVLLVMMMFTGKSKKAAAPEAPSDISPEWTSTAAPAYQPVPTWKERVVAET